MFLRESYAPSFGSTVCNSHIGNKMTDLLILNAPVYSEASLFKTCNDALNSFKQQCLRYTKNLIIGLLSINSLGNKFTDFKELILNEADVFFITERKLDNFHMLSFKLKDTDFFLSTKKTFHGRSTLFVKENIFGKILYSDKFSANNEIICIEFSICTEKWLPSGTYNTSPPHRAMNSSPMS